MEKKALSKSLCVVLSATLLPISSGAVIAGEIAQKKAAKANDLASVAASDKDKVFSVNCLEKSEDTITVSCLMITDPTAYMSMLFRSRRILPIHHIP